MKASDLKLGLFPHGTVYLVRPEHSPDVRRRDLENIKSMNFNTVVLWPPASRWDAPTPGGLAFDSIDQVMDVCAELGLKAIIELQGQSDNHGPIPESLPCSREWPSINHPDIRRETVKFIKEVAAHYKGHPALLAYDTFNEVHYTKTDPWTLKEFVEFLKVQYQNDIRKLNAACCTFFAGFEPIAEHGTNFRNRLWSSAQMQRDWFRFRPRNFAERLREWAAAIREVDKDVVILADILGCDTMHGRSEYGTNDWLTAAENEVHGLSCYANMISSEWWNKDAFSWSHLWRQQLSAARGRQVMISELMTPNRTMFPWENSSMTDQTRLWSYQATFNGIKGLIYWKWRPFIRGVQVGGRGLTDYEANPNDIARQAAEVAAFNAKHADLLAGTTPDDAGCAVLHDHNTQDIYNAIQSWAPDFYTNAHRGFFRGFWENGISPSYVLPEDLAGGVPERIKVLAVPCNVSVSQATANALVEFVKNGGRLLTEGRFGLLDENAYLYPRVPGGGMRDAFGIGELELVSNAFDSIKCSNVTIPLEDYIQELILDKSVKTVLKTKKGRPALVTAKLGKGMYVHVPFLLGRKIHEDVPGALSFFKAVFKLVSPALAPLVPILKKPEMVDVSVLQDADGKPCLVGICNYRSRESTVSLAWSHKPVAVEGAKGAEAAVKGKVLAVKIPARRAAAVFL